MMRVSALDESRGFGPHADLGAASPLGRFYAQLADAEDLRWQALEVLYKSGFLATASDEQLSLIVGELAFTRTPAAHAEGIATLRGQSGTVVAAGMRIQADNGEVFETTEVAQIAASGRADVLIRAEEAGPAGNVAAGTITTMVTVPSGVDSVENEADPGTKIILGSRDDGTITVANDGEADDYQIVKIASLRHPHTLDDLEILVRNDVEGVPDTRTFRVHLRVVDHLSGELLGRTETQTFTLDADEETTLAFTYQGIDVHNAIGEYIRVAVVVEDGSDGDLGVVYDTSGSYQQGDLVVNSVPDATKDMVLAITTRLPGATSGGADGETDVALRTRYRNAAASFGNATEEAVYSQIARIPDVHSLSTRQNRMDYEVDDLPPHSLEVTTYGGDPDEIAAALFAAAPAGCELVGSSAVVVRDSIGQAHTVRFNKATRVSIYADIDLTVNAAFSYDLGLAAIRDAIVEYIGGYDSESEFHVGLMPGDDVVFAKVLAAILSVDGIEDVTLHIGTTAPGVGTTNVAIDVDEVAETSGALITIEVVG
jgi:uncharacterized phage protein gp47/JayE